jgi:hypothetical protein
MFQVRNNPIRLAGSLLRVSEIGVVEMDHSHCGHSLRFMFAAIALTAGNAVPAPYPHVRPLNTNKCALRLRTLPRRPAVLRQGTKLRGL